MSSEKVRPSLRRGIHHDRSTSVTVMPFVFAYPRWACGPLEGKKTQKKNWELVDEFLERAVWEPEPFFSSLFRNDVM